MDGHRHHTRQERPTGSPSGLIASQLAHDSVILTWTSPSSGSTVNGYRVLRGTDANSLTAIADDTRQHGHGVHGLHCGRGDDLLLCGTGPEPGRRRGAVHHRQRHHASKGTANSISPHRSDHLPGGSRQRDHQLDDAQPGKRHRLPDPARHGLKLPLRHRPEHGQHGHGVHGLHRDRSDHLLLRSPGSERGRGRGQSAAVSATTPAAPQQATVPDLRLSSTAAGQLTISWDTPQPTPSDYRIVWAKQDLDFPSYTAANEANRGNEYPSGDEISITITGLNGGSTFKVKARTWYTSGGDNNGAWRGPWSDTVTTPGPGRPPDGPNRSHRLAGRPRQRHPELDRPHPGDRHRLPNLQGNRRRLARRHRPGHGAYEHRVYRFHCRCRDHLPLCGPGPEPGWRRSAIGHRQRHHTGRAQVEER